MEHRLGCRMTLSLPVEIWRGDQLVGSGVSRNLSHGGACIQCIDSGIRSGDFVSIKVLARNVYTLKAMVLHQSRNEIGVMWASDEQSFHEEVDTMRHSGDDLTTLNTFSGPRKAKPDLSSRFLKNVG